MPDEVKPKTWKQRFGPLILAALTALLSALGTWLGVPAEKVTVEKLVPVPMPTPEELNGVNPNGWVNDADEIRAAARTLDVQVFAQTPAGQAADIPKSAYLWKAYVKLFGTTPPCFDQNPTGSCVGFGTTRSVEKTLACEIVLRGGAKEEFSHFSEEVTYAGSRVEANGGTCPIRPSFRDPTGDGSNGGWAAKFVTGWGMVPKAKYGDIDLTQYSATRARSWNYSGVPDELEPTARRFPVKSAARILNWSDAKKALASGYGVQIASSLAVGRARDANGVAKVSGRWAHSMSLDGYHTDAGGKEYGHVENSWGPNYHTGPVGWGEPSTAGFWVESSAIDAALREGDNYAYSGATGFPARKLPFNWLILADPPKRDRNPLGVFALAW